MEKYINDQIKAIKPALNQALGEDSDGCAR